MRCEVFRVVRQAWRAGTLDRVERFRQNAVSASMMMAVGFAVRRDRDELIRFVGGEAVGKTARQLRASRGELAKGDGVRCRAVVKEESQTVARREANLVGTAQIHRLTAAVAPPLLTRPAPSPDLVRRENSEPNRLARQNLERLRIDGRLRQPHAFPRT